MKAISIRQPWAWCIIHAGKDIENRDWPTRFRGTVLVHASKGMTRDEYDDCLETVCLVRQLRGTYGNGARALPPFEELERGGIVGQVEIVGCVQGCTSPWFFGEYGFVLKNAKPLPFRPFKGALGFFDVPDLSTV